MILNAFFVAVGSQHHGVGHILRSHTLAKDAKRLGLKTHLYSDEDSVPIVENLKSGFDVISIEQKELLWQIDVLNSIIFLDLPADYLIDNDLKVTMNSAPSLVFYNGKVLDDFNGYYFIYPHTWATLTINHILRAFPNDIQKSWETIPIRDSFRTLMLNESPNAKKNVIEQSIGVVLGGTDAHDIMPPILNCLLMSTRLKIKVFIRNPSISKLVQCSEFASSHNSRIQFFFNSDTYVEELCSCSLIVSTFGVTFYELLAMKKSSIVIYKQKDGLTSRFMSQFNTLFNFIELGELKSQETRRTFLGRFQNSVSSFCEELTDDVEHTNSPKSSSVNLDSIYLCSKSLVKEFVNFVQNSNYV